MATDDDNPGDGGTALDVITYKLEGGDAKFFTIGLNNDGDPGALGLSAELTGADKGADFEGKPSYLGNHRGHKRPRA